jgi:hypothetical protein
MSGIHQILLGGGEGVILPLSSVTCTGNVTSGGTSSAFYILTSAYYQGQIFRSLFGTGQLIGNWLAPVGDPTNYEVRGTWTAISESGTVTGPTTYTAIPASPASVTWQLETTANDATYELLVEIRRIGSTTVLSSGTMTLETFGSP